MNSFSFKDEHNNYAVEFIEATKQIKSTLPGAKVMMPLMET